MFFGHIFPDIYIFFSLSNIFFFGYIFWRRFPKKFEKDSMDSDRRMEISKLMAKLSDLYSVKTSNRSDELELQEIILDTEIRLLELLRTSDNSSDSSSDSDSKSDSSESDHDTSSVSDTCSSAEQASEENSQDEINDSEQDHDSSTDSYSSYSDD